MSLLNRYRHKIKTRDELLLIIGGRPRQQSVIMCHGVFDIVHPGHIRHLLYAKGKADILVASITCDRHITKGVYRPHVPQELRALSLAAFDCVDYVIIDTAAKPIDNIKFLEPDFYAKGFEYASRSDHVISEADVVQSYGGEVIYTPGDIVYSSSALLNKFLPHLQLDKLQMVMDRASIDFSMLRYALQDLAGSTVHVLGDTIVDSYTHGSVIGGQTKTPTISVLYDRREDFVGGAAIVAKHIRAAGGKVTFSTVIGNDISGRLVLRDLESSGVRVNALIDHSRPTTNKNAIVAGGYRLLKIDMLDNRSVSDFILRDLVSAVRDTPSDMVVYSDFRHGLFNLRTIPDLTAAIHDHCYKVADSQVASRWGNIVDFKGFDLITPNEREARFSLGDQDSGIRPLASKLYDAAACKTLMLKLGERGVMTCISSEHEASDSFFSVDSFADRVIDPVGAGDALLAYGSLAMLVTNNPVIATIIGSMAAAIECEVDGNIPVTPDKVLEKINHVERQIQ